MNLKFYRACKVIGFTQEKMTNGWPQVFSLEHIAKLQFPENASNESVFFRALKAACTGDSLKHIATIELRQCKLSTSVQHHITELIRHELRDNSYEVTIHYVNHCDLAAWLKKQGEEPSAHLAAWFKAAMSDSPVPPVAPVGVSDEVDPSKVASKKPIQRTKAQDSTILDEIKKQGFDPLALPRNSTGKPGVKAAIRTALLKDSLFTGGTVFNKAWERMTNRADIVYQGQMPLGHTPK